MLLLLLITFEVNVLSKILSSRQLVCLKLFFNIYHYSLYSHMSSIVATRMQDVQFLTSAKGINLMIMCGMCNTFDHHGE